MKKLKRPGVREGYDLWSETYDTTPNPLVALDRRHALRALAARAGETIVDAGCGTGAHLGELLAAGCRAVGLDFSHKMLQVARHTAPAAHLAQADLNEPFPVRCGVFDALLCSLVSEHLTNLPYFFREAFSALRPRGRLVFSAFHPDLARSGVEANFERDGIEYRLGAEPHTVDDYLTHMHEAGFQQITIDEYSADAALAEQIPRAAKYLDRPVLLLIRAQCAA